MAYSPDSRHPTLTRSGTGRRGACVSLLLALGIHPRAIKEIVGHSAIEMTVNIYGHVNLVTQRAALDHLDEQRSD
jgi:integrase